MTDTKRVAAWYDQFAGQEHDRLGNCRLEFSISWRVITQYLEQLWTGKSLHILDLGGGTGRYALELAKLGHSVTLVDISDQELQIARKTATEGQVELTAIVQADARAIRGNAAIFRENKYDLVLCQGPIYHLLEEDERRDVLSTCAATLKPGGVLVAAFVLRYAHLRDIAQRDPTRLLMEYDSFYATYLADGKYTRTPLVSSYHASTAEVKEVFESVPGLQLERLMACEGFLGGGLASKINQLTDDAYEKWVEVVLRFAEDECILGNADHLLAIARRTA
ncbi:S-adenosyl-L-methionine-dependent methyltransferase [Aspergillus pseudoustus]|uniref:S-adenosyl-L-methionine-dependent methyltransferase n=1 Tax=Aspergillus pseudoustus TaxID=1810923 RepID=A0ABR4J7Q3_9EURO